MDSDCISGGGESNSQFVMTRFDEARRLLRVAEGPVVRRSSVVYHVEWSPFLSLTAGITKDSLGSWSCWVTWLGLGWIVGE